MSSKPFNPIAFNPDTMTVRQLKDCADALRTAFDAIDRLETTHSIVFQLDMVRKQFLKTWS